MILSFDILWVPQVTTSRTLLRSACPGTIMQQPPRAANRVVLPKPFLVEMHEEYWKHLETEQDYSWVNTSGLLVALVPIFRSPIRASRRPPQEHLHLGILSEITWRPLQSFTVFWCFYGCDLTVVEGIWSRAFGTIKHSCKTSPSLCSNNTCKTSCILPGQPAMG